MAPVCEESIFDFRHPCSRSVGSSAIALLLVLVFLSVSLPPVQHSSWLKTLKSPFVTFLPLADAEDMIARSSANPEKADEGKPILTRQVNGAPIWRSAIMSSAALSEALVWLALGSYRAYELVERGKLELALVITPFVMAVTWFYATLRPIVRPSTTPPYDLFILFCIQFVSASLEVGVPVYMHHHSGWSLPSHLAMAATVANIILITLLLVIILAMPLDMRSEYAIHGLKSGKCQAEEDYTTLWGWITITWVYNLLNRGITKELTEDDVPDMSPSMQSKPVFERFLQYKNRTLLRKLAAVNSLDLIIDITFTLLSVLCNYATPYFLKRILDDITYNEAPQFRSAGYVYALMMFLAQIAKSQADLHHLWFNRRAYLRARAQLMGAIYVKALKRKDFSGVTKKDDSTKDGTKGEGKQKKTDGPQAQEDAAKQKSAADLGKIMQLMSRDAEMISFFFAAWYLLYSAPVEILIASFMLYQLLGWSAFAGFFVLILASPLNTMLTKRSVKIQRGLSTARDKRMSALNELIGGIKFIKFFAWEEQWTKRVQEARDQELGWLIKYRFNTVVFDLLWLLVPTAVSIVTFATYVLTGNQLTISTAFTVIAIMNMMRAPLNMLPDYIIQINISGVALDRIAKFLEEDEVPSYVSSFSRPVVTSSPTEEDEKIGITGGSFAWNQVKDVPKKEPEAKVGWKSKLRSLWSKPSKPQLLPVISVVPATPAASTVPESWEPETREAFTLKDINVLFPAGQLSLVVGPTASGKSALLMALLGEMSLLETPAHDGVSPVHLPKNPTQLDPTTQLWNYISYCAQTPWLEHATIKDNILFGSLFEEDRYRDVIRACALEPDLKVLEAGDRTEIGSRGVTLSGGQKARVALARAVYARTKHVLLDDPLAAVDSHTARHLYDNVLRGPLMANRTCILVTHHVDLVRPAARYLVRMANGRIDTQGSIKDLESRGLLQRVLESASSQTIPDGGEGSSTPSVDAETVPEAAEVKTAVKPAVSAVQDVATATTSATNPPLPRRLVQEEGRAKGNVKWKIYKTYLKTSSYATWIWLLFGMSLFQLYGVLEKLWIRTWGEHYDTQTTSNFFAAAYQSSSHLDAMSSQHYLSTSMAENYWSKLQPPNFNPSLHARSYSSTGLLGDLPSANDHPLFYVGIFAAIGLVSAITSTVNSMVQYTGAYRASKILFRRLLAVIVGSPMRFFDTTPSGRILNRFSSDITTVDSSLSTMLRFTTDYIGTFVAAVITIVVFVPPFALPAAVIAYLYYRLSYGYVVTGRMLRRMNSTTKSPIFSAFGDLLEGLVTVRAFSSERRFVDRMHVKVDVMLKMWYGFEMTSRWLSLRLTTLGAASTLLVAMFAVARLDAGLAGLTITSAMAFTAAVYGTCRTVTQLEMDLNSVERVVEYLDLPQEPPAIIESNRVPAYWPSSNSTDLVVVQDLVIKYAPDLPAVLHGISFALKPRERVGLLGRTGSGKSTLAMALLRFVDPTEGKIVIDGMDISTIGLKDLRSRVTIIPQDAVLFSGTIRENLDPFKEHSDEECLDALNRVHLSQAAVPTSRRDSPTPSIHDGSEIAAKPPSTNTSQTQVDDAKQGSIGLDTKVSAGGVNFSQGQRQLIAMARALLRRSGIIIMDEATSSIDFEVDAAVQKTIREEFVDALLITIAHRIRTVIDYDRLIVMDEGRIVESGAPLNLIRKEGGIFREICWQTGHFDELLDACQGRSTAA